MREKKTLVSNCIEEEFASKILTTLDSADSIALISGEIHRTQEVLKRLENQAGNAGLHCNFDKIGYQELNQKPE